MATADDATRLSAACSFFELISVFLTLGATAFGGPAVHIALMESQLVRDRKWLNRDEFLDLLGAANLIPGPSSTELAMHVGYKLRGIPGLVIAGVSFILPAFCLVVLISSLYLRFSQLEAVQAILYGLKPVIVVIVLQAVLSLALTALKNRFLIAVAASSAILFLAGVGVPVILFGWGMLACVWEFYKNPSARQIRVLSAICVVCTVLLALLLSVTRISSKGLVYTPSNLFLYFAKTGSLLYGGGYVLLAFLRSDLVENCHWLTSSQLLDAIAIGQITPGPFFITATFIGFLLGGLFGACIATIGMFLPAFVFVAITAPFVKTIRSSLLASAFLDSASAAAVALMIAVMLQMVADACHDLKGICIAVATLIFLFYKRVNPLWLMLGGAIVGLLFRVVFSS
ncbi:MAG: chromate efflux transporter [Candidatus Obscuribacterales bacterium]|nr:chromate efflux transporter [Candidatus Obscuribacterales bacterium]